MLVKKLLWSLIAAAVLMSTGCCRMWDRWCDRPHYGASPGYCAPACAPTPQQCCPPGSFYQPTQGVAPVPPAPGAGNWARCP